MKRAYDEFHKFHTKWQRAQDSVDCSKLDFIGFKFDFFFFNRKCMVDVDVVITLLNPAKVLFHVWSYDFMIFYDTALSTTVTIKLGRAKRFCVSEHSEQRRFRRACVFAQCIFSQKARPLAYLSGWACAFELWYYGGLEDTFSLGGAGL